MAVVTLVTFLQVSLPSPLTAEHDSQGKIGKLEKQFHYMSRRTKTALVWGTTISVTRKING